MKFYTLFFLLHTALETRDASVSHGCFHSQYVHIHHIWVDWSVSLHEYWECCAHDLYCDHAIVRGTTKLKDSIFHPQKLRLNFPAVIINISKSKYTLMSTQDIRKQLFKYVETVKFQINSCNT